MKISVAIATYNGERFLPEQLNSLYDQTRHIDEIVVSDDGSTDGTIALLEEYEQERGLIWYKNEGVKGVNGNFFHALSHCTGDVVMLCDQDDVWLKQKVKVMARTMEWEMAKVGDEVPIVISSLRWDIDADGNVIGGEEYEKNEGWRGTLLTYGRNQGCTMMMNRKMVQEVLNLYKAAPEQVLSMYYDEVIAYMAVIVGKKVNLSDQLMYYRHHDKNVVDRAMGKLSFRDKVRLVPTFWGLTLDERWQPMHTIHTLLADRVADEELEIFLRMVDEVVGENNGWRQLGKVMQCKVLPWTQRAKVGVKASISICLKKWLKEGNGYV